EAIARREVHPPGGYLLRCQLADAPVAEHRCRLAEQVAKLLDRHRLHIVLGQVRLDELGKRQPSCDPAIPSKPLELALARIARILLRGEPAPLDAPRVAPAGPIAVRPQPRTASPATHPVDPHP